MTEPKCFWARGCTNKAVGRIYIVGVGKIRACQQCADRAKAELLPLKEKNA